MLRAPFDLLYRRLGPSYPKLFVTVELLAGLLVTAVTVGLLSLYYEGSLGQFLLILAVSMTLTGAAIAIALFGVRRQLEPVRRWIAGDHSPESTEAAWLAAVELPIRLVRNYMLKPIIGVILPSTIVAVVVLELGWLNFFPLLAAATLAGAYGAMLHHLTLEIGMRPVLLDINRSASPRTGAPVQVISLRHRLTVVTPLVAIVTGVMVAAVAGAGSLGIAVLVAILLAGTVALELTLLLSRSIATPVVDLQRATEAIQRGDLDVAVPVTTADELGELAASFNQMVAGLREREEIRETFGKYLDHEVAEHILSEGFSEQGEIVEVSILFCDVRGFTRYAATASTRDVVARLNELFEVVVPVISRCGGHVDKFVGDGLMAVFGAPEPAPDHADRAVKAATEIDRIVNVEGLGGGFGVGIGINTGRVLAASVGGGGRLNFSVIGDAVNIASRVEEVTRETGDRVLLTAETRAELTLELELVARGAHEMKGIDRPVMLFAPADAVRPPSALSSDPVEAVRAVYARVRGQLRDD